MVPRGKVKDPISGERRVECDCQIQSKYVASCQHGTPRRVDRALAILQGTARRQRDGRATGTEGFHNKMELINRQAYGNYRLRVKVLCR